MDRVGEEKYGATILIASSQAKVRQEWVRALQRNFAVGEVSERGELEEKMVGYKPSILVLDLALHRFGKGFAVFQRLNPSTQIILLAATYDEGEALKALKAGAKGYCEKHIESCLIRKAVNAIQRGEIWAGRKTIARLLEELPSLSRGRQGKYPPPSQAGLQSLTPRESEIARLVGSGGSNKEIAQQLNISERTVKAHLTAIFNKLHIPDRLRLGLLIAHSNQVTPR